ncbi:MAG: hypothetical protein AAF717_01100 [Bacteroidota bacterium]
MNRKPLLFSLVLALMLLSTGFSQKKTETYKEVFNVGKDAVLELNTSHSDIEFETWDKNQVEIVATVTLEGASEEEANDYFESSPFEIVGNSKEIEVSTSDRNSWNFIVGDTDFDFDFNFDVEPFFMDLEIPDLPELMVIPEMTVLPPMPPIPQTGFDYGRYKEEGESYLKEWKKEFEKGYGKEYKERMEEWGKRVEEQAKAWEERNAKRLEERERRWEERAEAMEKRQEELERKRAEVERKREEAMEKREKERQRLIEKRSIRISRDDGQPNIFYYSSDGENKKYKVKKSIKIKMPKSVRLKMNVKHGEVKLAATTRDINASLRYASLLASTIEGDNTRINASYSPVVVTHWNYGELKTDYSERVNLKEVGELLLNSVASNIVIEKLNNKASLTTNLGKLSINAINPGFSDVKVFVKNGEVLCKVPNVPVSFYLNGTKSRIDYPADVTMNRLTDLDNVILKGFRVKENSGKVITIDSKYSDVVLKE